MYHHTWHPSSTCSFHPYSLNSPHLLPSCWAASLICPFAFASLSGRVRCFPISTGLFSLFTFLDSGCSTGVLEEASGKRPSPRRLPTYTPSQPWRGSGTAPGSVRCVVRSPFLYWRLSANYSTIETTPYAKGHILYSGCLVTST